MKLKMYVFEIPKNEESYCVSNNNNELAKMRRK